VGELYLLWADICSRYPNEWVLIVRPDDSRRADVLGGWVLAHSPCEDDIVVAMDLAPIHHELVMVKTDPEMAKAMEDLVYTLDYLAWRPVFLDDEPELESPTVHTPKRWWQFWR